jgi:hypothetical protein
MTTSFSILCAQTVLSSYSWDQGVPFDEDIETPVVVPDTTTEYISGYAPAFRVYFQNKTDIAVIPANSNGYINFEWNFGDFYNDRTNKVSLSCPADVRHTYIMPGKYTVSLTYARSVSRQLVDIDSTLCFGKYNINWYWDKFISVIGTPSAFNAENFFNTWDEVACDQPFQKWWDDEFGCYQKYCKYWSWEDLKSSKNSKVTWDQAETDAVFEKKWQFEANDSVCTTKAPNWYTTTDASQETVTKTLLIDVKELPPKAGLFCITTPLTGISPYRVRLSPRTTECGSFPIDRIDWDFNDGSPIQTVVRQNTLSRVLSTTTINETNSLTSVFIQQTLTGEFVESLDIISPIPTIYTVLDDKAVLSSTVGYTPALSSSVLLTYYIALTSLKEELSVIPMPGLIYNGTYFDDLLDPRNYDLEHTYYRNLDIYPVFYPSITAYSSNTSTSDSCCTTVGPILNNLPQNIKPVKVAYNQKELIYAYSADETCTFISSLTSEKRKPNINLPKHRLVNDKNKVTIIDKFGNFGENYAIDLPPTCEGYILSAEYIEPGPTGTGVYRSGIRAMLVDQSDITTFEGVTAVAQENNDFLLV